MGLPKKAKGGSKNKSKGGKEKGSKPKEPTDPQTTVEKVRMHCFWHCHHGCSNASGSLRWGGSWSVQVLGCHAGVYKSLGPARDISWVTPAKQVHCRGKMLTAHGTAWEYSLAAACYCIAAGGCASLQTRAVTLFISRLQHSLMLFSCVVQCFGLGRLATRV